MLKSYVTSNMKKLSYKDLIIFLIPFIIFICYLYVFDPAIMRFDTYNQLNQIAKWEFFNWHPFFHTFIEMICIKIYPNPISISILQIVTFSTMWMIICNYFRQDNNRKNFVLQLIVTIIIALIPINAIFSITLLKDTLFSYFMQENVAYAVGYFFSLTIAFFLSSYIIFKKTPSLQRYIRFLIAYIPYFTIVFLVTFITINTLKLPQFTATVLAAVAGGPITFVIMRVYAFGRK